MFVKIILKYYYFYGLEIHVNNLLEVFDLEYILFSFFFLFPFSFSSYLISLLFSSLSFQTFFSFLTYFLILTHKPCIKYVKLFNETLLAE